MTLIKAKVKKKKIIIGSWHGSNRGSDSLRKDVVKELCLYMGTISGNPWIVGGDFNVEYSKIENDIPEDIKITSGGKGKLYIFSIQIKSV